MHRPTQPAGDCSNGSRPPIPGAPGAGTSASSAAVQVVEHRFSVDSIQLAGAIAAMRLSASLSHNASINGSGLSRLADSCSTGAARSFGGRRSASRDKYCAGSDMLLLHKCPDCSDTRSKPAPTISTASACWMALRPSRQPSNALQLRVGRLHHAVGCVVRSASGWTIASAGLFGDVKAGRLLRAEARSENPVALGQEVARHYASWEQMC